jgi:hypothetical protein
MALGIKNISEYLDQSLMSVTPFNLMVTRTPHYIQGTPLIG